MLGGGLKDCGGAAATYMVVVVSKPILVISLKLLSRMVNFSPSFESVGFFINSTALVISKVFSCSCEVLSFVEEDMFQLIHCGQPGGGDDQVAGVAGGAE